jgi:DNA-binding transcriptional MerR regulator
MKTGDMAKTLNVSRKTIANWVAVPEIRRFFSEGALRMDDDSDHSGLTTSQRDFNDEDLLVLNTIRLKKTRMNTWADVVKILESGQREGELPASALLVETLSPVEQARILMLARKDLEVAQGRIADLEDRLAEAERLRKEERDELQAEIRKLDREKAVLEYQLEQLKTEGKA